LTFARIFKGIFEGGWRNARENGKVELQTFSIKTQESITKTSFKFCQYQSFVRSPENCHNQLQLSSIKLK
jgi:hypothetical protein